MEYDLFVVKSATQAQRMVRTLNSGGIRAGVQRLPLELASRGCAYAVRLVTADSEAALSHLQRNGMWPERIVRHDGRGYREVAP